MFRLWIEPSRTLDGTGLDKSLRPLPIAVKGRRKGISLKLYDWTGLNGGYGSLKSHGIDGFIAFVRFNERLNLIRVQCLCCYINNGPAKVGERLMKISTKLLGLTAVALVLTIGIGVGSGLMTSLRLADDALRNKLDSISASLKNELDAEARRALSMAEVVAKNSDVAKAFAAQDRDALARMFVPGFDALKSEHAARQFQFHLPPATSFLRVHKPEKFGDDLSSFRFTVLDVNRDKQPVSGLEVGVAGLGMRGVAPISWDGNHVGSVEFGLSFGEPFFQTFTQSFGAKAALFVLRDGKLERFAGTFMEDTKFADDFLAKGTEEPAYRLKRVIEGDSTALVAFPVQDFTKTVIGVAVIGIDRAAVDATIENAYITGIVLAAIGVVILIGLLMLFRSLVSKPIGEVSETILQISRSNYDVDVPYLKGKDEIGTIARSINNCLVGLREAEVVKAEQVKRDREAEQVRRRALLAMADAFEQRVMGIVKDVVAAADAFLNTAQGLTRSADTTSGRADSAKVAISETLDNVSSVSAATEELAASIREITGQIQTAAELARGGSETAKQSSEEVEVLAAAAEKIGEVVDLINDIAEQTNLLALNATIEAARAGEAGKGFAVVANEVKSLAMQTGRATEEITSQVQQVQSSVKSTISAISELSGSVNKIDEVSNVIAAAAEEQSAATQEIARSVETASTKAKSVGDNVDDVVTASDETRSVSTVVDGAARDLSQKASDLQSSVAAFLAEIRGSSSMDEAA